MSRRRNKNQQPRRMSAFERETERRRAEMLRHLADRVHHPRVHAEKVATGMEKVREVRA